MGIKGGVSLGERVVIVTRPVSWSRKAFYYRRWFHPQSKGQVAAQLALAELEVSVRGRSGKINGLPVGAAAARRLAGRSTGFAVSMAERKREQYAAADGTIARLRAQLSGAGPAGMGAGEFP
ncbi:MAG TPA: hypothetical protein VMG99_08760 [Thermoplasmata archaeon]|nr:hypothetical protein [Thermoplasmata archaeon]